MAVFAIRQLRYKRAMLSHIRINDYTIVDELDLDFDDGMTVITGETGAGKSIMLDALGLCLGDRADPASVRAGCDRAERADFETSNRLRLRLRPGGDSCRIRYPGSGLSKALA